MVNAVNRYNCTIPSADDPAWIQIERRVGTRDEPLLRSRRFRRGDALNQGLGLNNANIPSGFARNNHACSP